MLVFLFGSNFFRLFPTNRNLYYEWGLTFFLLALALLLRTNKRTRKYWRIAYALFIVAFATALNLVLGDWLGRYLPAPGCEAQSIAIDKLSQAILLVLSIILLTLLSGDDLGSIFLKKGNLKQGLQFGLISFGVCAAIFAGIVFALGLVNGFAMLKTDSIWGSVLFHAGYDLLVIIPILVSVQ